VNGQVTTEDLADDAVTSDKIADGAVTSDDLAPGTIPTGGEGVQNMQIVQGHLISALPGTARVATAECPD
jgi:hypothetical protein